MIPRDYITAWRAQAPWVQGFQVEQDLIISRTLVSIFSHALLRRAHAFRFFRQNSGRFSMRERESEFAPPIDAEATAIEEPYIEIFDKNSSIPTALA